MCQGGGQLGYIVLGGLENDGIYTPRSVQGLFMRGAGVSRVGWCFISRWFGWDV